MVRTRAVSDRLRTSNFRSWLMKTFLANAFAVVSLEAVQEFHLCRFNTNAPNCPYWSLRRFRETNKIETTSYSIIPCTNIQACKACSEHSNFFKVKLSRGTNTRSRALDPTARCQGQTTVLSIDKTVHRPRRSNYELFNRNNINIRYWSWNYRGCWHQTCPPIVPR